MLLTLNIKQWGALLPIFSKLDVQFLVLQANVLTLKEVAILIPLFEERGLICLPEHLNVLTVEEVVAVVPSFNHRGVNWLTLCFKRETVEKLIDSSFLADHFLLPTLKKVHSGQHFPALAEDANLEILSYLDAESVVNLSLTNKETRILASRQDIWQQRVKERFGVIMPPDSSVLNMGFYQALKTNPFRLIVAMRAGFSNMFGQLWPEADDYRTVLQDAVFRSLLEQAIVKEDIKVIFSLLEQDLIRKDIILPNDHLHYFEAGALLRVIRGSFGRHFVDESNIIYLCLQNRKIQLLINIVNKFIVEKEMIIETLKTLCYNYQLESEIIAGIARTSPPLFFDLAKQLVEEGLSCLQIDNVFTTPVLLELDLANICILIETCIMTSFAFDASYTDYLLGKIAALPSGKRAFQMKLEKAIKNKTPLTHSAFLYEVRQINEWIKVCSINTLEFCFANKDLVAAKIILSHATSESMVELAKYAFEYSRVIFFFEGIPVSTRRTFLNELPNKGLSRLMPESSKKSRKNVIKEILERTSDIIQNKES